MVGPKNLKPRAASSFDIARDSGGLGRHLRGRAEAVDLRLAVDEVPQELREARAASP